MSWNLDNAVDVEVSSKGEWNLDNATNVKVDTQIDTGFDIEIFTGRQILRGSINTYRIHIWNFFMPDMRLEVKQQKLIESGELKPKITPDGDSELCEKAEFLKSVVKKIEFTPESKFYLVVHLDTWSPGILEYTMEYLREFGIKVKYELAGKDELKGA